MADPLIIHYAYDVMTPITLAALALAGLSPAILDLSPSGPLLSGQKKAPEAKSAQDKETVDPDEAKTVWEYLSGRYDANGDGKIDQKEYTRGADQFKRLDKDGNGFIDASDAKPSRGRGAERGGGGGRRGGGGGAGRGGRGGSQAAPTEGSLAPDFELETLYPSKKEGEAMDKQKEADATPEYKSVSLASFKEKKPVALIFGSYT